MLNEQVLVQGYKVRFFCVYSAEIRINFKMIIRKITPMKMKAVIVTDSISLLPLRGRHHPFTRPRAATLSVAITAYTMLG